MRWRDYKVGEERIVRKFLWWPMCLKGETRWLESASVRQVYVRTPSGSEYWCWVDYVDGNGSSSHDALATVPPASEYSDERGSDDESYVHREAHERVAPTKFVEVVKTSRALKDKYAVEILVGMGSNAIPILLRAAQTDLAGVQPILSQIGPELAVPPLIDSLKNANPTIRQMAAVVLWFPFLQPKSHEAVPALVEALRDDDSAVRCAALRSIVAIVDVAVSLPFLRDALRDNDASVRRSSAAALGQLGQSAASAIPLLVQSLKDEDAGVREAAASTLREIGQYGDGFSRVVSN